MPHRHALGHDVCLLAPKGVGKTCLARRFAQLFGYGEAYSVFCHADLPAHELLQRRATTPDGATEWRDSPLLLAARRGGLALLDGIHRLPRGTFAGAVRTLSMRNTHVRHRTPQVLPQVLHSQPPCWRG